MNFAFTIMTTLGVFLLSTAVNATTINQRQSNQSDRIQQGVVSGELTLREANKLDNTQRNIARTEARFKADGAFTKKERAIIKAKQARASKQIKHQKHDRQSRP